tara:strand:+ start:1070 stop:2377 length:1308 start_codon:yes stop_codon:yes gene_type:complete
MFKMGGSAGTGITSGLDKPRQNYQEAGSVGNNPLTQYPTDFFPPLGTREIKQDTPSITTKEIFSPGSELLKAFENRNTRPDLSRFLIDFGLNLASRSPTGSGLSGLISTAAAAAKDPAKTMFEQKEADDAFGRKLKLAATQMDIDKKLKEEFAEKKFANDLALALATVKPETKTAAVKNALAMGLEPGTKAFNDYVTASTIKGAGLDIQFNQDGTIKSISEGAGTGNKKFQEQAMELKNATFAMNNVASALLNNLQGAKVGTVGSFFNVLDSFSSQLKQLADSTGFSTNYTDQGTGAIDAYLEKQLPDSIFKDAVTYGKIRSNAINLAYLMARVDEPGGRFTDRDIALKMEEIGIGANPEKTAQILSAAVELRNKNAGFAYKQLTGEDLNFEGFKLQDLSKSKKTNSGTSGMPEYIIEGDKVFEIIDGKRKELKL